MYNMVYVPKLRIFQYSYKLMVNSTKYVVKKKICNLKCPNVSLIPLSVR